MLNKAICKRCLYKHDGTTWSKLRENMWNVEEAMWCPKKLRNNGTTIKNINEDYESCPYYLEHIMEAGRK